MAFGNKYEIVWLLVQNIYCNPSDNHTFILLECGDGGFVVGIL